MPGIDEVKTGLSQEEQQGKSAGNDSQDQTAGTSQLPSDPVLDIAAFSDLFSVMSQSHKLLWFISVLDGVREGKSTQVFGEIVDRMVAEAWSPVVGMKLRLGLADTVERLVQELRKESGLPANADKNAVLAALKGNKGQEIQKLRQRLIQFAPYRLMSPFLGSNWKLWDDVRLTVERINSEPSTLYTLGEKRSMYRSA